MIRAAVTCSLVQQARGGPFVYWDDLEGAIHRSAELGFHAIEIFAPGPQTVHRDQLAKWLDRTGLKVAAVGTGAGWLIHKLALTDPDAKQRAAAVQFVREMIDFGAEFDAPAIIGSMQGRAVDASARAEALDVLADGLRELAAHAASRGVKLIYEPLNRYETNLCNTMAQGAVFLKQQRLENVILLADLFHMNIEEVDIAKALSENLDSIGHVHFVDSNRRAAGYGHLDYRPIREALRTGGYQGYLSAEVLALPDSDAAARQTMAAFREGFTPS